MMHSVSANREQTRLLMNEESGEEEEPVEMWLSGAILCVVCCQRSQKRLEIPSTFI